MMRSLKTLASKPLFIRRVVGESMMPGLKPGRIVFGSSLISVNRGNIVMANAGKKEVIKRISRISDHNCDLVSDHHLGLSYYKVPNTDIVRIFL